MILSRDIYIIDILSRRAIKKKINKKYTIVSALAYKNKILAIGQNNYIKTHPIVPKKENGHIVTIHSEIDCILKYQNKFEDSFKKLTLYTVALTCGVNAAYAVSSKPCALCMEVILKHKFVNRIVFTEMNGSVLQVKEVVL